jgi:predicted dehydrogenase
MGDTVRVGIIGAGSMGALHARVVNASQRSTLAWVADPNPAVGQAVAQRFGVPWVREPCLDEIDVVVIAAPTQHHVLLALEVLDAGKPLLLEKPLANTATDAALIVERSAERGVPLMCGLLERFNPAIRTAMQIVEHPLHLRTVRHSPYVERIRTGVASDLLIHDADLAIRVFAADPIEVRGQMSRVHPSSDATSEDIVEATMLFPGGGIAALSASRLAQRKVRELVVAEIDRSIEVDLLRQGITIYRHVGEMVPTDEDGLGYRQQTIIDIPVIRHLGEPLALQWAHFVGMLDGTVDPDVERDSLLPPHRAVQRAVDDASLRGVAATIG